MPRQLVQCAANFSEGRDLSVVRRIVEAAAGRPGAYVADWSSDADHNRMVVTLVGEPVAVAQAILAAAATAVACIDMRSHRGVHPRLGAIDVVPFTPLREMNMDDANGLARVVGRRMSDALQLPVFFYERSALPGRAQDLPTLRRGGFEAACEVELRPDVGPNRVHPTAGAAVVGARAPLVAFNVNLAEADPSVARRIASTIRRLRSEIAELAAVRALGLALAGKGMSQVSLNLTRPETSPLPILFDMISVVAEAEGIQVAESELIGLAPASVFGGEPPDRVRCTGFAPTQLTDFWLSLPVDKN
ncbi:MAG: glutamate formimidoyltransferase [Armatimonadetes bacterium]|nr:glutamate formimidoyltransferase [Armatimonadota bacterium]